MKIILTADVPPLGRAGDVVSVKDGYARNYLFPRGAARTADPSGLRQAEMIKQRRQAEAARHRQSADALAQRLAGMSCTIAANAQEDDRLYGSVGAAEIVGALGVDGVTLDKAQVLLEEPIKALGIYQVPVRLHPDVTASLKVWVVRA